MPRGCPWAGCPWSWQCGGETWGCSLPSWQRQGDSCGSGAGGCLQPWSQVGHRCWGFLGGEKHERPYVLESPVMGGASPVPACRSGWLCPVVVTSAPLSMPCVCPGSDNSLQLCVLAQGLCVHLPGYTFSTQTLPAGAETVSSIKKASSPLSPAWRGAACNSGNRRAASKAAFRVSDKLGREPEVLLPEPGLSAASLFFPGVN